MPLSAWRKWWRRSSPRSKKPTKKPYFRKCFLEILEDRVLLSANAYTVNLVTDNVANTGQQTGTYSGDLRWCIEQADLNPGSTIQFSPTVFPSSTSTTIHLSQGELPISASMNIEGPGASTVTVSGDASGATPYAGVVASRVFDVTYDSAVVTISGLTITGGNANVAATPVAGNQGGDIFNGGQLTLQNDVVTNGFSIGNIGGPNGRGGAIFNAEGDGNTQLTLDNTIVEDSLAEGVQAGNGGDTWPQASAGGNGGEGLGGGIYNDVSALLIVEDGSQITDNTALGGNGGNGGDGPNGPYTGAAGGRGGAGGAGGLAQGGGIYNNGGSLELNGTTLTSIVIADNVAQGGEGGLGGNGGAGIKGPRGGNGGNSSNGGDGGLAEGGGVYNTGSASFPATFTLNYVDFQGDQAIGGAGNNAGVAGAAGSGTKASGGTGGFGGQGGLGGNAQGGGIYSAWGALTVPNTQFGVDANGVGNQAIGGAGGNGGNAGNGGNSTGGTIGGEGNAGGSAGDGGAGGNAGFAKGGAVANVGNGGGLTFQTTSFLSSLAQADAGGSGGNGGVGGAGAKANNAASTSPHSAGLGGLGGSGGAAGAGGAAVGGGVFNSVGSLSIASGVFLSNEVLAGAGGVGGAGNAGGVGGSGTSKGSGFTGGVGGVGGVGGQGGAAQGGGFYNLVGSVTVANTSFAAKVTGGIGNEAVSGSGGGGGNGGNGGDGGKNASTTGNPFAGDGGNAGNAGLAANAGLAEGGAGGNQGGDTLLSGDIFTSNLVKSGAGGNGGNGGTGGDGGNSTDDAPGGVGGDGGNASGGGTSGPGEGGAFADTAGALTVTNSPVSTSTFGGSSVILGNQVVGGAGGAGGIGGGIGHWGNGASTYNTYAPGSALAGNGGAGGQGASVYGGSLFAGGSTQTVQITDTTFTNSAITSGAGGAGGQAGLFSLDGAYDGLNGPGGNAGLAQGGAVSISASAAQNATLSNVAIAYSTATGSSGGAGAINDLATVNNYYGGWNGYGSIGGNGGSVQGVGLAAVNYNLTINGNSAGNSSFDGGVGQGGTGGTGGTVSITNAEPGFSWQGGAGGNGGSVLGGGVFFSNKLASKLAFNFNGGAATGNALTGGVGGNGGFAGASGSRNVAGGAGGNGGSAQGGGIYIVAGSNSINAASLSNLLLADNVLAAGTGGVGGGGYDAAGGNGGAADGGGVFNTSVNATTPSSFIITGTTVVGNQATGGIGGDAGNATTPNGGAGGVGGKGGNAEGGGLLDGDNISLTVVNSTFGGGSTNSSTPNANANILIGSRGGSGGDADTPAGVAKNNGGAGGAGGSVEGGNVYIASSSATFINDTLVYGQADDTNGTGGHGGSGAGEGGANGAVGVNGVGSAGGYFAASGGADRVGNTIIALNSATNPSSSPPSASPDVSGTFTSLGYNIVGSNAAANGFTKIGDQINVTATQLNIGPLLDNGGPTPTDALLNNMVNNVPDQSVAIGAGGTTLVTNASNPWFNLFDPNPTDQRGSGFARLNSTNNTVDVGAFEYQAPTIASLSPDTDPEFTTNFGLTITGTGFMPGATVSFDGAILTPTSVTPTTITVTVPGPLPPYVDSPIYVTVDNPDGSGVAGETLNSAPVPFIVTASPLTLINPGTQTSDESATVSLTIEPEAPHYVPIVQDFSAAGLPAGLSINAATGVISGTIDAYDADGSPYTVTVTAYNGPPANEYSASTTFTWNITAVTPPVLTAPPTQNNNEGDTITSLPISAVEADPGTFTDVVDGQHTLPTGLSIDPNTGVISGTIGLYAGGTYTVTISASRDGIVGSCTFTWNVAETTPPELTNPGTQTNKEGDNVNLTIQAVHADTFSASGLPPGLSINTTSGVISGTVGAYDADSSPYMVTVTATRNGYPSSINFTWDITPATPPSFTIGTQSSKEGDTVSVSTNPFDADPNSITATGLPPGLSINATTGVITGTIDAYDADNAPYTVTLSAIRDGTIQGGTMFTWDVSPTSPPTFTNPGTQSNKEGDTVSVSTNPFDADANSITATGLPPGLSINATTGVISGTVGTYDADSSPYTVTVSATRDGTIQGSTIFTWDVSPDSPPGFTNPGTQNNKEGDTVSVSTDPIDADPGSITATGLPPGLNINSGSGVIFGTIDAYDADNAPYTVTVSATRDGTFKSSIMFTWNVAPATPPGFTVSTQNNKEGDTINVSTNPIDADAGSITATGLPPGLSINATTGVITGTIDAYDADNAPYTVTISATRDGTIQGSTQFTWNVSPTSPPTFTNPGTQSNKEGDTVNVSTSPFDADPGSITAIGLPPGLSINSTTGVISGTIGAFDSDDSPYTVTVSATRDGTIQGSILFAWNVALASPPGFTNPGTQNNKEGDTVNVQTDPVDADPGTIKAIGLPAGLSINSTTGVISGTIGAYAGGTYEVSVSASRDGHSSGVLFTWNVAESSPPSLTSPGTQNSNEGTAVNLAVTVGGASAGSITATGLPPGLSINSTTGVITGTVFGSAGVYQVAVSAARNGHTATTSFDWVVNPLSTSVVVTNVSNSYVGLFQVETVTAQVTNPNGAPVNEGDVAFQVNGQTVFAPVVNGFASTTIVTSMFNLDMTILLNDFFSHSLDAVFSDPAGIFGSSAASVTEPAILLDFLLSLETGQFGSLVQQLSQFQTP